MSQLSLITISHGASCHSCSSEVPGCRYAAAMDPRIEKACSFQWLVWGVTVVAVLTSSEFTLRERDLDCVELWSGVGAVYGAARLQGLRSQGFDIIRSADENTIVETGFRKALDLVNVSGSQQQKTIFCLHKTNDGCLSSSKVLHPMERIQILIFFCD